MPHVALCPMCGSEGEIFDSSGWCEQCLADSFQARTRRPRPTLPMAGHEGEFRVVVTNNVGVTAGYPITVVGTNTVVGVVVPTENLSTVLVPVHNTHPIGQPLTIRFDQPGKKKRKRKKTPKDEPKPIDKSTLPSAWQRLLKDSE